MQSGKLGVNDLRMKAKQWKPSVLSETGFKSVKESSFDLNPGAD